MKKIINSLTLSLLLACYSSSYAISVTSPVDFDDDQLGVYTKDDFIKDWQMKPNSSSGQDDDADDSRLSIVTDGDSQVLQVKYLANEVGGSSAMTFTPYIGGDYNHLPGEKYTHLYFQFKVKFKDNFTWVKGGKLPGLTSSPDSPTGCVDNADIDGFSARLMWRENGQVFSYLYNPFKKDDCGDYDAFSPITYFNKGQWYTITQEVQLNDVSGSTVKDNGFVREWLDGVQVLDLQKLKLRDKDSVFIDEIKMDTFFGGSSDDWAPTTDQYAYFDHFAVSESSPLTSA